MAMKDKTKTNLLRGAAGVVAVLLVLFGIKECKDRNDAVAERDEARTEAEKAEARAQESEIALEQARDSLNNCINCRSRSNRGRSNRGNSGRGTATVSGQSGSVVVAAQSGEAAVTVTNTGASTNTVSEITPASTTVATGVVIGENAYDNTVTVNNNVVNNYYGASTSTDTSRVVTVRLHTGRYVRCR